MSELTCEIRTDNSDQASNNMSQWLTVAILVYLLICAVSIIGGGFKMAAGGHAKELFEFASNPFAGLVIGTIATALIQSSSTVTSIIVGLVAGGLPVSVAVPMVMGANIGTSITNTIVSLGHVKVKHEFSRAFSAATVHDFFNLFSVLIFLPLEMTFGLLEKLGSMLAEIFYGGSEVSMHSFNFVKAATAPVVNSVKYVFQSFGEQTGGVILIVFGIVLIFLSITIMGKLLKKLMVGKAKEIMHSAIGRSPLSGIFSGTLVTILVQSSSTTTSLMVPLAGSGSFSLKQIYPFTLGANIGTCVTAVLAATAVTGNSEAALQIAFIHLTYNILGVVLIYSVPFFRYIPVNCAQWMGRKASENKMIALAYILSVFFIVPALCILVSNQFQ
jgi:sodium-dependent phosphate cotransporter